MLTNNLFKRLSYRFFAPDLLQREAYEAFKCLLDHDRECHELIADFQDLFFKEVPADWSRVVSIYKQLSSAVGAVVADLNVVSAGSATDLYEYYKKFDSYICVLLQQEANQQSTAPPYIMQLDDCGVDPQFIGNKGANLAKLRQNLSYKVPKGFVVTTNSWHALLNYNNLRNQIDLHLASLDTGSSESLNRISQILTSLIETAALPPEIDAALITSCKNLRARTTAGEKIRFAVRSSAVHEDGENSFAGQYLSVLDVVLQDVRQAYLQVLASKYSPSALLYRISAGISDTEASMAVLVLEMVDAKAAGVIYTEDPTGEEKHTVFIHSVEGGGEKLVGGKKRPHLTRLRKETNSLVEQPEPRCPISEEAVKKLGNMAISLEEFFGVPLDIEWVIGEGEPQIIQSRPLNIVAVDQETSLPVSDLISSLQHSSLLYHGGLKAAMGRGIGTVCFLGAEGEIVDIPDGSILVVENIPPSLVLHLSKCEAVIAVRGSVASHFATICREFSIPLIVEAIGIKEKLVSGESVIVDADTRNVYRGGGENCAITVKNSGMSLFKKTAYYRRLKLALDFIAPLNILDPDADSFVAESCRSFHDIIRYAHEKGVQAMFAIGQSGSRRGHRKRLVTTLPFELYLIDVDGNLYQSQGKDDTISSDQVNSIPFQALWQGLSHHSIAWGDHDYYNWKEYDNAAMTDGFAFKNTVGSASYAVCGRDYLNLNIRFGYHFTIVDTLCGENDEQNYCSIRFAGGGGTFEGRFYRLQYIEVILRKLGFQVTNKTDLLDGRLSSLAVDDMAQRLFTLGRMLGTTKLMDMVLKDDESVLSNLDLFFSCNDTPTIK